MGLPDFDPLQVVAHRLSLSGIPFALGGSGLLYVLGLEQEVHDWDLTTDASRTEVETALRGLSWEDAAVGDGPFASRHHLRVRLGQGEVDLMGGFAIRTPQGTCHLPTVVHSAWKGIPVGSPEVWAVAYRLMGRDRKADLLSGHLRRTGGKPEVIGRLLDQPLPPGVREEVLSWNPGDLSGVITEGRKD